MVVPDPASVLERANPLGLSDQVWLWGGRGARVLGTLVVAYVLLRLVPTLERLVLRAAEKHRSKRDDATTSGIPETRQRAETLTRVVGSIARALVRGAAVVAMLGHVGVEIGPLLAGAGIAGVAVGFGAQTIVKDFFAGFFILLENQYDVGDSVVIANVAGKVERMTMRITVLRDDAGTAHFIPNSSVTVVANRTDGWSRAAVEVVLGLALPDEQAQAALTATAARADKLLRAKRWLVDKALVEGPLEVTPTGVTWRVSVKARATRASEAKRVLVSALRTEMAARRMTIASGAWAVVPEAPHPKQPEAPTPAEDDALKGP